MRLLYAVDCVDMYVRLTDLHHSEQRVGVVLKELPEGNGLDPGKTWRGDRTGG